MFELSRDQLLRMIVSLWVGLAASRTPAQSFSSSCISQDDKPPDECVITNPKILHLYWNVSGAAWDADAGAALTRARLDGHMLALTRATYFSQLSQYSISAPEFVGSITSSGCANPNTIGTGNGGPPTANLFDLNALVECARDENPAIFANTNVIVLYLPPQLTPAWGTIPTLVAGQIPLGGCGSFTGFHVILAGIPTVVVPLRCTVSFASTFAAATGLLVNTVTDPDPIFQTGFVDTVLADRITFGTTIFAPEISHVCPGLFTSFLDGAVSGFWSQSTGACTGGFVAGTSATVTSVRAFGAGKHMRIVIGGSGFGAMPPDLLSVGGSSATSLYFRLALFTPTAGDCGTPSVFLAGHSFDPLNTVGVIVGSWTDSEIRIHGFGGAYDQTAGAQPGHLIGVSVANRTDGLLSICSGVDVPLPTRVVHQAGLRPITPGQTALIHGQLTDSNQAAEGGVPVALSAVAGNIGTAQMVTTDDGLLQTQFTAPGTAGLVPITVSFPSSVVPITPVIWNVPVAPVIESLEPQYGVTGGGTVVTITGRGFVVGNTTVAFAGVSGSQVQVLSDTQVRVSAPASPNVGPVEVRVSVGGVSSAPPGLEFTYIIPFAPYLTFSDRECASAMLSAQVFDTNGQPVAQEPVTITASQGLLVSGNTNVASLTVSTEADGRVRTKMITSDANSNNLTASAHTARRPFPDEVASTAVMSKHLCGVLENFHRRRLKVRFVVGDLLGPHIIDGCHACSIPSRFRVDWRSINPALSGMTVSGFPEEISFAKEMSVSILGADKATGVLEKSPLSGEVVSLVELSGTVGKVPMELAYTSDSTDEVLDVVLLSNGEWEVLRSTRRAEGGVSARLPASGIYAIVVKEAPARRK